MSDAALFAPPGIDIPAQDLGWREFLRAARGNALRIWPRAAYEQLVLEQRFLGRPRLLLNDPTAIHRVLVERADSYRRTAASIRLLRPIVGDGLLLSEGDAWRHQRRSLAPAFRPRTIGLLARPIAAVVAETVRTLRGVANQPVALLGVMQHLALEIAGRSMFSLEIRDHGAAMRALLEEFAAGPGRPFLLDLLLPISIPSPRDFARRRFRARWMALIERIIAQRMQAPEPEEPRDLLDLLRAARDPLTGAPFSPPLLRDQVATMIVAGHETTALTLFWSLYLLASAPAEQARVAAEVATIDLGEDNAAAALSGLAQTRAVVSEALRLYPPAFAIARQAIAADSIGGHAVDPGTMLLISPWVLHRHRRLWRAPEAFDPTRFLPDAPPIARFAYLPFGAGPRVCIGASFAMAEATLALAALIQAFEIMPAESEPVRPVSVITTHPDRPATFHLRARSSGSNINA